MIKVKYLIIAVAFWASSGSAVAVFAEDAKPDLLENPLKTEMQALDSAFKNLITSLVLNNLSAIEEPFHEVHKAKHKTEEAIERKEIVLPKNSDKIAEFTKIDHQFHHQLEILIKASRKGDLKEVQKATHTLLDACIHCHTKFRNL
jgi:cytochrome c556